MFVLDRNIYFNTDHAVTGKIVESRGMRAVSLRDARDNEITVVREEALNPPAVLIAGPVTVVFIDDDGTVTWASVIAWRLAPHCSTGSPVFAESPPRGHMFMVTKDNAVIGLGGRIFKSIEAATKAIQTAASLATLEVQ
jgi:hypothetical protein